MDRINTLVVPMLEEFCEHPIITCNDEYMKILSLQSATLKICKPSSTFISSSNFIDDVLSIVEGVHDAYHVGKVLLYYADAEKYRKLHDELVSAFLKQKCIEEFNAIKTLSVREKLKTELSDYLQ